ncbi:MAG: hypothetical protein PVI06_09060 [Desulfobacterales bacterium]
MEEFLDILWFKTVGLVHHIKDLLDGIFAPLNALSPAIAIFSIAFMTVVIAKFLTKTIKTKRYKKLKKEFLYWRNLRQETQKCEDRDKSKLLAKNIDQAKLNKVYYDFFLEGFLLSLATKYLPIFSFLAYVNEAYKPDNMTKLFGRDYIFKFGSAGGEPIIVGSVFWFVICILLVYLGWFIIKKTAAKYLVTQ